MSKLIITLILAAAVTLVACASDGFDLESAVSKGSAAQEPSFGITEDSASFSAPAAAPIASAAVAEVEALSEIVISRDGESGLGGAMQSAERKVISTASIGIVVDVVETAIGQAQAAVEDLGGFVEHLTSSGGPQREQANMTLRVPQDQFSAAVAAIEALGSVQSRNLGTEDVSAQFIDLEARLKSSLGEEQSLLRLLERTDTVGEILTIERELFRVRADIERAQGQLNFLERRVELATIHLSLFPLEDRVATPPSASLDIDVSGVDERVAAIKGMVASADGAVDGVFLSIRAGRERADLTIRVFTRDFERTIDFLEAQGEVINKELTEGTGGPDGSPNLLEKPEARIEVSLLDESGAGGSSIPIIIGIVLGSVAGGAVVIFLGYLAVTSIRARAGGTGERFA